MKPSLRAIGLDVFGSLEPSQRGMRALFLLRLRVVGEDDGYDMVFSSRSKVSRDDFGLWLLVLVKVFYRASNFLH